MKRFIYTALVSITALCMVSCNDWLRDPSPGVTNLEDYFTSGETAIAAVNAAYVPLQWEYNSTFFPEWFIGDVVSDDALKGGQYVKGDMDDVYDMENFQANSNNTLLLDYYRAQYQGVQRANLIIEQVPLMDTDEDMDEDVQKRLVAEAKFLRAVYLFRLARVFGNVPLIDKTITSSSEWKQPQATQETIYRFVANDLEEAELDLWEKSDYPDADLGRATKGAAQAMLLKVYLYLHEYAEAEKWGEKIYAAGAGEYSLCPEYSDNFSLAGENGPESVFEIQYALEATSDYGEGFGSTRGTFTVVLTRSRSSVFTSGDAGWGFNKPSKDLYAEYEAGDPRLGVTILEPTDAEIEVPAEEIYLGNRYVSGKYALMTDGDGGGVYGLSHPSRGPINNKMIRYADVLLMYAEACCENQKLPLAKQLLEEVRSRARTSTGAGASALPAFPYGSYSDNQADLRKAIRHERRVELGMEGHRWFDLVRWGVAKEVMDAYRTNPLNAEATADMNAFVEGVNEIFPIPAEEIRLGGLDQNTGYF